MDDSNPYSALILLVSFSISVISKFHLALFKYE